METAVWQTVSIPHTWNVSDVMDDTPGYYRGEGWYRKKWKLPREWKGKQVYLCFNGANQVTKVFINGKKAGEHTGGYTGFTIPLNAYLDWNGDNSIAVCVDNSFNQNIPPLSADFTFYGGLYRGVSLMALQPVHFSTDDNGSQSVFITTPQVSKQQAVVNVRGKFTNEKKSIAKIKVLTIVLDKDNNKIGEQSSAYTIAANKDQVFEQTLSNISSPHLWSPDDPYLYKIITRIVDAATGNTLDEVSNPLGFRWFRFDAAKGFFLNDQPLMLVGTSRHQDYQGLGNAVPTDIARKDVALIKEMGGNFLRVAHYPQDPAVMQACDELGLLTSVEIPVVNEITETDTFYNNCLHMQREMIRQNFNHPSVVMWCYMNEVLLRPHFNNDKPRQKIYFNNITKLARSLDSLTRKEDPTRYTMMAHHGDFNRYKEVGLIDIPMVVGWNLYSGWYGANMNEFPAFLDQFHKNYPNKPMAVTEYGADADPRIRSNDPLRFDKSVEYATAFHQFYMKEMLKRPFVSAAMVWNLADFNSETRTESMPHINNKGLLEWDRKPKDVYYYYKAILSDKPFIKILGTDQRPGMADSIAGVCWQKIQVAATDGEAVLFINDQSQAVKTIENGIAEWRVPFSNGSNTIRVQMTRDGKTYTDEKTIECRMQPFDIKQANSSFRQLNVLLGAKRFFQGEKEEWWIPDQEYRAGSWGHIGGKPFKLNRLPYGTDKDIKGTFADPVYQTQQVGIQKYRVDAPDGDYELTLYFAELLGGITKPIPYNLDSLDRIEPSGKRIFDVWVNDSLVLKSFNIIAQYGPAEAVQQKIKLTVKNGKGIEVTFKAIEGEPVLNALQVRRSDFIKQEELNVSKNDD